MSTLKQVLAVFENTSQPLTIAQIARQLDVAPGVVEDMITFWVRKGRLRDMNACGDTCNCGSCGVAGSCPFVVKMPGRYELVSRENRDTRVCQYQPLSDKDTGAV